MIRCITIAALTLLCAGCTVAAAPETGVRGAPPAAGEALEGRVYRRSGPGAGLMVHEERLQMDSCTRFSSWDYCRQEMWGY